MSALMIVSGAVVAALVVYLWRKLKLAQKNLDDPARARLLGRMELVALLEVGAVALIFYFGLYMG